MKNLRPQTEANSSSFCFPGGFAPLKVQKETERRTPQFEERGR